MPSSNLLSLFAVAAYAVTALLALAAAWLTPAGRRGAAIACWLSVALVFVAVAGWRFWDGEARLQDHVRSWTRVTGLYDDRQTFQVPVTLGAVLLIAAMLWFARRAGRSGQALGAALMLLVFTAVRAISLHAVDAFVYASVGPVHVNYLIDLGLTAIAAALALADCAKSAAPPPPPSRRRHRSGSSRSRD